MSDGTAVIGRAGQFTAQCLECDWQSGRLYQTREKAQRAAEAHRDKHHNYAPPSEEPTRG